MSVIGTVEAVPNRLKIIWSVLREEGTKGIDRDKLKSRITPSGLGAKDEDASQASTSLFDESLGEFLRCDFARMEDKKLFLEAPGDTNFVDAVGGRLLALNVDIDDERGYLAGALAWFLTRRPTRPLAWGAAPVEELRHDFGDDPSVFDITNASRWQNFAYWARFLGFASFIEVSGQRMVVPDPRGVLGRLLDEALLKGRETPIATFFGNLAARTPVFEGGAIRRAVEERLRRGPASPREISETTAFALRRLQIAGELQPLQQSDAEMWTAPPFFGSGRVSHLKR